MENETDPVETALEVVAMTASHIAAVVINFMEKAQAQDGTRSDIVLGVDEMIEGLEMMVSAMKGARTEMVKDLGWDPNPKGE